MKLALLACLASLALVSGHVIGVYNGQNIPIRGAGAATSDGQATVAGPCGQSTTFGDNGITMVQSGTIINMQLKYQQPHPNGAAGNQFAVGIQCSANKADLTGAKLQLYSNAATLTPGPNMATNSVGITPVAVPAQDVMALPFIFPFKTPEGASITAGEYCIVAILDERNWGSCIDLQVKTASGPIVAGVMVPAIGVGAAAALWFGRGPISAKLLPKAEGADPAGRMMWNGVTALISMVLAIVACALPNWSVSGSNGAATFTAGPWKVCPSTTSCYDSATGSIAAVMAVRVFTLTCLIAGVFACLMPILVHFDKMYPTLAAKSQTGLFLYMAISSFISIMLWSCILLVNSSIGAGLIICIVVCILSIFGTVKAWQWWKATEVAATAAMVTSGPIGIAMSGGAKTPVSYPSQPIAGGAYVATSASSPSASALPPPPPPAHLGAKPAAQKWGSWEEMWDAENNCFYFFNHSNGESSWEAPEGWPHKPRA